jgi:hypothetical protein
MPGKDWTSRVSSRNSPQDLQDIRDAARDLGREANRLPGQKGVVFQNVSQYIVLASVAATASLAFYHLWKELSRSHGRIHDDGAPPPDRPSRRHARDAGHHVG